MPKKTIIIACRVFMDELVAALPKDLGEVEIVWIDAGLHDEPYRLKEAITKALKQAQAQDADIRVLYGNGCEPDLCSMVKEHGAVMPKVKNCIEGFCRENTSELEKNRTVIMTPGWVRMYLENASNRMENLAALRYYDRILVMDAGINSLADEEILEFYDLTEVPIEVQPLTLDGFKETLAELFE